MVSKKGGSRFKGDGGSSNSVCPGFLGSDSAISNASPIIYYVSYNLFFVLTLGVMVYTCCVRKRSARLNPLLLAALAFMSIGWALIIIGVTLRECWVLPNVWDYYDFVLTYTIFFNIGQWLLLFIHVWGVNYLLGTRIRSGRNVVKFVTLAISGFMAVLTIAYTGLSCYNSAVLASARGNGRRIDLAKVYDEVKFAVAYWVLYLVSVIAGGAISVALLVQLRSKQIAVNDVMKRSIALSLFMVLWVVFQLVPTIESLEETSFSIDTNIALYYLNGFFQIFAYFAVVSLCKLHFWKDFAHAPYTTATSYTQPEYAPLKPPTERYAYDTEQQLGYNELAAPQNASGHVAHAR